MDTASVCRRMLLFCLAGLLSLAPLSSTPGQEPGPRGIGVRQNASFEPVTTQPSGGNAGLFVGINQFGTQSGLTPLRFAVHDAIELAYAFVVQLRLIPAENCWLLIEGQPTAAPVQQHLTELKRLNVHVQDSARKSEILDAFAAVVERAQQKTDLLICCFSSHGFQQATGSYIMPADGKRQFLVDTGLSLATIEDRMGRRVTRAGFAWERGLLASS